MLDSFPNSDLCGQVVWERGCETTCTCNGKEDIVMATLVSLHVLHRYEQPSQEWFLLYRGSRDGFHARKFHSCCDEKGATVVLVKVSKLLLHNTVNSQDSYINRFNVLCKQLKYRLFL